MEFDGESNHVAPPPRFGGSWTEETAYIDAFAGAGYREPPAGSEVDESSQLGLIPELSQEEPRRFLEGSARIALRTSPRFDRYIFIDRDPRRSAELGVLEPEFPDLTGRIEVRTGDANGILQDLCDRDWRSRRAVLFLDPFGMQVDWKTIEAIARTKAIDLWVLFPLGAVNRLLTRSGEIPESWRQRLNRIFGAEDWYDEFYRIESTPTLFDESEERRVKVPWEVVAGYFNKRLASVFAGVADPPGVLKNSKKSPLFSLCFAVGNERGREPAVRIANHVLKGLI